MVLGLGMNKIVFPASAVGVGDGNHFAGDLLALDNERNTPAVPLTSKPVTTCSSLFAADSRINPGLALRVCWKASALAKEWGWSGQVGADRLTIAFCVERDVAVEVVPEESL